MLLIGTLGAAVFGTAALLVTVFGLGGVAGLIVTQFLFSAMNGLILANGVAGALSSVQTRTGAASALVGAVQYGSGMVGSAVVGIFANGTPIPMVTVMAFGGIGSLASARWTKRRTETHNHNV
jgi:DHA1 family bicyclomycin/chloramphenicol resistance-like MFS transporter